MDASFVVCSFVCRITMGTDRCSWPRTSCSKVPQRAGSEFWVPISLACCPCVVSKALDVELFGTEVKKGGRLPCEQEALTLNIVLCATGYLQVVLRGDTGRRCKNAVAEVSVSLISSQSAATAHGRGCTEPAPALLCEFFIGRKGILHRSRSQQQIQHSSEIVPKKKRRNTAMEYEFLSGCGGLETTGTAVAVT